MKNIKTIPVFVYIVLLLCLHTGLRLISHSPKYSLHQKHKTHSATDDLHLHHKHKTHSATDDLHLHHKHKTRSASDDLSQKYSATEHTNNPSLYSSRSDTTGTATRDVTSDGHDPEDQNVAGKPSGQELAILPSSSSHVLVRGTRVCRNTAFLLVAVCSAAENFRHRDVIRRTWASGDSDSVEVVFVVGLSPKRQVNDSVRREATITGDVLLVMVADDYRQLTLKTIALLNWTKQSCGGVRYLLKTDDDTYVNVPRLLTELRHLATERFIMGDIIAGARPERQANSKWYTPASAYRPDTYPDYVSGSAYVVSADLIRKLYEAALLEPLFWIEDVFITGICAARIRATLVHNSRFKSFVNSSVRPSLLSRIIALHRVDPERLLELWRRLKQHENRCK